jgi:hypothetical protein
MARQAENFATPPVVQGLCFEENCICAYSMGNDDATTIADERNSDHTRHPGMPPAADKN